MVQRRRGSCERNNFFTLDMAYNHQQKIEIRPHLWWQQSFWLSMNSKTDLQISQAHFYFVRALVQESSQSAKSNPLHCIIISVIYIYIHKKSTHYRIAGLGLRWPLQMLTQRINAW